MIEALHQPPIQDFLAYTIREDIGSGDHTSLATIPDTAIDQAYLLVKESGIIAGVDLAKHILRLIDPRLTVHVIVQDGTPVHPGDVVFKVEGSARSILMAERLVLNFMQRMSGIATKTHRMVQLLHGTKTRILDTRKTTPGMRFFEKWAVRIGGGTNHRFGLYDMILIKDNHIDFAGGIANAIQRVQQYLADKQLDIKVEIEVRNLTELQEVLHLGGVDIVLLDNFDYATTRQAVTLIDGRFTTESSGNITLDTVRHYADCGVDFISSGALTHTIASLDLSLKAERTRR